jgi:hypothetical protein
VIDILGQMASHLELGGVGLVGQTIFASEMPKDTSGVLLFTTGEGFMRRADVSRYFRGTLYVATRGKNYAESGDLASKVFNLMDFEGKTIGDFKVLLCRPEGMPMPFGRDESGMTEWLSSYELTFTMQ